MLWNAVSAVLVLAVGAHTHSLDLDPIWNNATLDGGDLKLLPEQLEELYGNRTGFGASTHRAYMWEDGIVPYVIRSADFYASDKAEIEEAMHIWERDTCIKFVPRTTEEDYVQIQDGKEGCNSYKGNIRRGEQPLNLGNPGCLHMGTYLHEFGHLLGLMHEHQRPSRNDYMYFYKENVSKWRLNQLKPYSWYRVKQTGVPFDISSIMLYDLYAFSYNDKPTLGVENTFMIEHINARRYRHLPSFGDMKAINNLYHCNRKCTDKQRESCKDPNYVNNKCECVSMESYLAKRCKNYPDYEDWCDKKARTGYCRRNDKYQQRHCMKSCDFCPIYLPGTSGLEKPKDPCVNHYSDSATCDRWAKMGICKSYPIWIQRHCRKSCDKYVGTCSKEIGLCANLLDDHECDSYANSWWDYCGSEKDWGVKARRECPDACKVCPK